MQQAKSLPWGKSSDVLSTLCGFIHFTIKPAWSKFDKNDDIKGLRCGCHAVDGPLMGR